MARVIGVRAPALSCRVVKNKMSFPHSNHFDLRSDLDVLDLETSKNATRLGVEVPPF